MTDILEKLRGNEVLAAEDFTAAADEIERLRRENWELVTQGYTLMTMIPKSTMVHEIRAAREKFSLDISNGGLDASIMFQEDKDRIDRLEAALEPFAELAKQWAGDSETETPEKLLWVTYFQVKNAVDALGKSND